MRTRKIVTEMTRVLRMRMMKERRRWRKRIGKMKKKIRQMIEKKMRR